MCFAPILLLGYLFTLHPNAAHVTDFETPYVQAMTCDRGPGLDLKASPNIGTLQAQYGIPVYDEGPWSLSLIPKAGGAMLAEHVPESQSRMNFALSLHVLARYEAVHLGLEYLHESNAHLGDRNAGMDFVGTAVGFSF